MMLRLNLLPVRQVKKREVGRQWLVLAAGVLILTLVSNFMWWKTRNDELEIVDKEVQTRDAEIKKLDQAIGQVNNLTRKRKENEDKLATLEMLKKGRLGSVKLLDALATAIPKKVYLKNFSEKNNEVELKGVAYAHEDVSDLMKNLNTIVWTPRGLGRVVERKKGTNPVVRVELLEFNGEMDDFSPQEAIAMFSKIDLKKSELGDDISARGGGSKRVKFDLSMSCNYAL